ncbi:MAG: GNAT family N-acetyltransferase [Pseudomonadota bacterium]
MPDDALKLVPMSRDDLRWLEAFMRVEYPRAYASLWRDGGVAYVNETFSVEALEVEHSEPGASLFRVVWEDAPAGFVRVVAGKRPPKSKPESRYVYLHRIYLAQSSHGRGLGREVMNAVIALAADCDVIWLESMAKDGAVGFYERLGFQTVAQTLLEHPQVNPEAARMVRMVRDNQTNA